MAQGIKVPLEVKDGRLVLSSGEEYIKQLVFIALGDGYSANAFQDIGVGEFMIFSIARDKVDGEIRKRVSLAFDELEESQLAAIDSEDDITITRDGVEQYVEITYTDLETGARPTIEVPIPPAGEE